MAANNTVYCQLAADLEASVPEYVAGVIPAPGQIVQYRAVVMVMEAL
ncbi:hypothetical protein IMZ48_04795 [Candidatus Bathyarchaeota archaeon]|nr:hypothetical protein [Candidatus Bathyarchaeota archaeon]